MTTTELKRIASSELEKDGQLSKGTRITIVEKARAGEHFSIQGSTYDIVRIGAALRKSQDHKVMSTYTIKPGKRVEMTFNELQ